MARRLLPTSEYCLDLRGLAQAHSGVPASYKPPWTRTGNLKFHLIWIGVWDLSPLCSPEFGMRTPGGGVLCLPLGLGVGPSLTTAPPHLHRLFFPSPTFPGEQVAGTEDAREDRSISARLLPGAAAAGPRGGRAGRSPGYVVRPRDRVRRPPRRWAPEEEEGNRRGRSGDEGARWGEAP